MKKLKNKLKGRKLNNRGFTMVEILVAMAILGVVSLTIYSFMMTGSRFYQRSSADADIQSEAQLVANTISDLIIDCEVNISYDEQISNSINPGSGGTIYAQGKTLEISNTDYQFLIFHDGKRLFYLERRPDPANPNIYEAYDINKAQLLAENITAFNVDLSRVSGQGRGKNIVTFTMTYEEGGRSYSGNYQVNLRNSVSVSANSITPKITEANLTMVTIAPTPITIDVKGKDHPVMWIDGVSPKDENGNPMLLSAELRQKIFTANSDAVNVGREDIYEWSLDGEGDSAYIEGPNNERKMILQIAEDLSNVPSSFRVMAKSTIPNKANGTFARGEAMVYYKKILDMAIVPARGLTSNKMDPNGTAVFNANITDYNLTAADRGCTWVLEYKTAGEVDYTVCNNASYATGRVVGNSYAVQLGSSANEYCSFRLTATSRWDDTWSAQYIFGVTELATVPGIDTASRGVEFDVTELFTNGEQSGQYTENNFPHGIAQIIGCDMINISGADVELFEYTVRDGRLYIYIDYDALRYAQGERYLYAYRQFPNLETNFQYICLDGHTHTSQTINWTVKGVAILPSSPLANTAVLISKGNYQDVSFTTQAYNLSRKNQVGIYLDGDNVNANEYGMLDMNNYFAVNYISALGSRQNLIQAGIFRLTAKGEQATYPTDATKVVVAVEDYYVAALKWGDMNGQDAGCCYTFDAYIANVEGMDLFVKGPTNLEISNWTNTVVVHNSSEGAGSAAVTATNVSKVTFKWDEAVQVGNYSITFHPVRNGSGSISYYEMTVNGKTYYYNATYRCWRPVA